MADRRSARPSALGTFGGVFTPSVLTILGLVLFLRLGFVVGSGGLGRALLILGLASSISLLTSVSLSAIATNRRVRGGGDYYLISRSIGVWFGGALGLVLFTAQAVSVAFYCVGFGDAAGSLFPGGGPFISRMVAAGAAGALGVLAYLGADLATRFQYGIMAVLFAGLASFFAGGLEAWDASLLGSSWEPAPDARSSFWYLLAIFFPAVTGFTQGVSMSGDLRDPARSLPLGTFLAVGVSTLVYLGAMLVLAGSVPVVELASDYGAMRRVASFGPLVDGAVLAATLSSALASFLGAPRILQALARDRVFGLLSPLAAGHGPTANPRRGVVLTAIVALVTIAVGSLDAIAALVTMFFLISYGLLNYATYVEATAASPAFRPRFRYFDARASLLGAILCGGVMLAIDPPASAIAVAIVAALYQYAKRTAIPVQWRDSRRAYRFRRVKEGLRELGDEPEALADWQPEILVFSEGVERRERVLRFASWIAGGCGLVTAVQLVEGDPANPAVATRCRELEKQLHDEIEKHALDVHPLVVAAPDLWPGASTLVQSWGVGPVRANTVVLNWLGGAPSDSERLWYGRTLSQALRLGRNAVIVKADEVAWERLSGLPNQGRRIDIWWTGDETSRLGVLLAYLITRDPDWDDASLRVLVPTDEGGRERVSENLRQRLDESRIEAEVEPVVECGAGAIVSRSRDAAVVFLPMRVEGMRLSTPLAEDLPALLDGLPVVALVSAVQDIPLTEKEAGLPDEADRGASGASGS